MNMRNFYYVCFSAFYKIYQQELLKHDQVYFVVWVKTK